MKWRLTGRFLMTMVSIVILVIMVNTAMLLYFMFQEGQKDLLDEVSAPAETFTRSLQQHLTIENGQPMLDAEGLDKLRARGAWMQILDASGKVVWQVDAPETALAQYRPVDIVQTYKHQEHDMMTTMFIAEFEQYSYLVGMQDGLRRVVLTFNPTDALQVMAKYLLWVIVIDLVIAVLVGFLFSSILTKPVNRMMEHIQRLKNGQFAPVKFKRAGIYKQVFMNIEDVSTSLQAQEEERKRLEVMRNEWMSNVSHDMKTPLASIQGYAELLKEADHEAERVQYAEVIERKSIYMRDLLEDFNLTMRLRSHKMPLQLEETKLDVFVREMVIDVLNDPQYEMRELSFDCLEAASVKLDQHLMKRAVMNFIVNALVHNAEETVVDVVVEGAVIRIRDNGRGMREEDVAQVFERYYRGSNTDNVDGTGLGTAIARDIIEAHGGKVTLTSVLGEGTTVTIEL